jgi:hypothetical protein
MEWKWSKANEKSLAQLISDRTVELLPKLSANRFDLVQSRDGRLKLVECIYDQLLKQGIQYAYEKYHPEAEVQRIRTPAEVLSAPGEGTCLDLALVFCGLCFGYDLLPLLILIEGHALAAVSLNHQRRDWNSFARERTLFNSIELFNGDENKITLQKLIKDGAYVAVECTGFAGTQSFSGSMPEAIQRTPQGTLTFERAIAAGQEQLNNPARPFQFAIDVAAAHYVWKIDPLPLAHSLPTLLTYNEFAERVEKVALTSHKGCFAGRETICQQLQSCLDEASSIIILHGSGGLGKTRLLLKLPDLIPKERSLWYVRNEAESVEPDIASLDKNARHIIVVDDAHRFSLLDQLREVIVNPQFAGKVTLILATRNLFKDSLINQLGLPGDRVKTIEVKPLYNQDIDQILQNSPHNITEQDSRHAIIRIAEGNPLCAGITAGLYKKGISLNLTRDQVLTSHLDQILKDLSREDKESDQKYIRYLQILAALGHINLDDRELMAKIYEVVEISEIDEERMVSCLVKAGLIEKYWKTIMISSEVLTDYILIKHFFDSQTKQANYQKQIIEPFFSLKPIDILSNLAKVEIKCESSESSLLLQEKLDEFYQLVNEHGNIARLNILVCLRDIAYLKPDDILNFIEVIIEGVEQPPQVYDYPEKWRGSVEVTHARVLYEAVELLERTIYRGGLQDAITYLQKLTIYQANRKDYEQVREKAKKALIEIAEFKPRKSFDVQLLLLERISKWLEQDFYANLSLSLALIQPMLKIDFHSAEAHPIKPHNILIYTGSLEIGESLRQIRDHALEILYTAYCQVKDLPTRLQIVQVLCNATYCLNFDQISSQTHRQLQSDCAKIAYFFSKTVVSSAEPPILNGIKEWLWQAKNFNKYEVVELDDIQQQLRNHQDYQLYCLLIGGYGRNDEGKRVDWQTAERQQQQKINEYVEAISSSTLEKTIQELEAIVKQAHSVDKNNTFGLNDLLRTLGETHLELAQQLIVQTIAKNLNLKQHLGFVLAGMRLSDREIARGYVRSWVAQDDSLLWVAIAKSYHFIDWSQPQLEEEWNILRQLVAKQSLLVDVELFRPIQQLSPHESDLAVELLKALAARGDEPVLHQVAETISWSSGNSGEWVAIFGNPKDLLEIIQNFERLSCLDYEVEECLKRLADISPMQVIDFIERRIKVKYGCYNKNSSYRAFPTTFSDIFDAHKSKPEYSYILRRVRNWMLQEDPLLRWEAPTLLQNIALNLDDQMYDVLMEWVNSEDSQKHIAVARILENFNSGQAFYNLSRELIIEIKRNKVVQGYIKSAICSTPGAIIGPFSNHYRQRKEEIESWLQDENRQVRRFAQEVFQSLETSLEQHEAREKLEERNW